MEYQPLPPVSQISARAGGHHLNPSNSQLNTNGNGTQMGTMQPPLLPLSMPLQVVHNLQQLNSNNNNNNNNTNATNNNILNNNNNNNTNSNNNSQSLPPPTHMLLHHQQQQQQQQQGGGVVNGGGGGTNGIVAANGHNLAQFQVQQLWRQHAYLNGNFCF